MRLWHYRLLPVLPKSQLLAQWRELNSIFVNQPRHILINYVYDYPKSDLKLYSDIVVAELRRRRYAVSDKALGNFKAYFGEAPDPFAPNQFAKPFQRHHDSEYLAVCFCNLLEKYRRGQADFDCDTFQEVERVCRQATINGRRIMPDRVERLVIG